MSRTFLRSLPLTALLSSLSLAFPGAVAAAQVVPEPARANEATRACLSAAPQRLFAAVPVYLTFSAPRAPGTAVGMLRLLVQDAASRVRLHLAAEPGRLPIADGRLTYSDLDASVNVHLAFDGTATITPRSAATVLEAGSAQASEMLLAALRVAIDSGGPFVWSSSPSDTVRAEVSFDHPAVGPDGPLAVAFEFGVPVFSMRVPVETPVTPLPGASPAYPPMAVATFVEAEILVHFVVDAEGRVEERSFRAVSARVSDPMMEEHFVAAVRDVLPKLRFLPARIANCPVRQLVQHPFRFSLR